MTVYRRCRNSKWWKITKHKNIAIILTLFFDKARQELQILLRAWFFLFVKAVQNIAQLEIPEALNLFSKSSVIIFVKTISSTARGAGE